MRHYDSTKPLVFVHLPRTGGTSLLETLRGWLPGKVFVGAEHWQEAQASGGVIWDHWSRRAGKAAEKMVGLDAQFVTFLRRPVDRLMSTYAHHRDFDFEQKRDDGRVVKAGRMSPAQYFAYFGDRLAGDFTDMMPLARYPEFFEQFVFVGITERYQESLVALADVLGKPRVAMHVVNAAKPYEMSAEDRRCYESAAEYETEIYRAMDRTRRTS